MQLIVHLTLIQVVMPAIAQVFMSAIFEWVCKFDLVDTSELTSWYYAPEEPEVKDSLA